MKLSYKKEIPELLAQIEMDILFLAKHFLLLNLFSKKR
ncbi:hypothetical protein HNQ03_000217 [Chryseobacterium sp. 16F]|uniref:Uncharacterized protein n=1 Tax=Frigoriflavimonas asaccharolytica TaxID=2735899 RepID=A0A8J8G714_9FLAO|nr:hypothetical protein [Frigoriflavimonas asaccharolytica]